MNSAKVSIDDYHYFFIINFIIYIFDYDHSSKAIDVFFVDFGSDKKFITKLGLSSNEQPFRSWIYNQRPFS